MSDEKEEAPTTPPPRPVRRLSRSSLRWPDRRQRDLEDALRRPLPPKPKRDYTKQHNGPNPLAKFQGTPESLLQYALKLIAKDLRAIGRMSKQGLDKLDPDAADDLNKFTRTLAALDAVRVKRSKLKKEHLKTLTDEEVRELALKALKAEESAAANPPSLVAPDPLEAPEEDQEDQEAADPEDQQLDE